MNDPYPYLVNSSDFVSTLVYISQFKPKSLQQYELENISLELYDHIQAVRATDIVQMVLAQLDQIENQTFFIVNNFKINISNKWLFKLIVLSTLIHYRKLYQKSDITVTIQQKQLILQQAISTFLPEKMESIIILRLIESMIKKNRDIITSDLALQLVHFSQKVVDSPFENFKHYALSISKTAISSLNSRDIYMFLNINLLPIRGVETSELIPYYKEASRDRKYATSIITKVIKMFSNNIENREGGFLYRSVLFKDFSLWKDLVWVQFSIKLQTTDLEGEFFQSLIKYWIPQTVSTYRHELFRFICTVPTSDYLKGYILLETRKRGFAERYSEEMIKLLINLFSRTETSNLGLKIISCFTKKTLTPSKVELQLMKNYIYSQGDVFSSEELKCLYKFLSQIGVVASELLHLEDQSSLPEDIVCYKNFVINLLEFCLKLLRTNKRDIGAQLLILLWKLADQEDPYILNYKTGKNSLGFYHSIIPKEEICKKVAKILLELSEHTLDISKLVGVVPVEKIYSNDYLFTYMDDGVEKISIKTAESVRNLSVMMVCQNEPEENVALLQRLCETISKHFQHFCPNLKSIFKGVLLFEALLAVSKFVQFHESYNLPEFETYALLALESILQNECLGNIYERQAKKIDFNSADDDKQNISSKNREALFNVILQYILQDSCSSRLLNKPEVSNILVKIIKTSNMRRPTTMSADALKHISKLIDEDYQKERENPSLEILSRVHEDKCYKIKLLQDTLENICEVPPVLNLTIRRNPESRLIIHALCQSDTHTQKPLLNQTMFYLLKILSCPNNTDSAVSSAFHCMEILMSDNTMYNHTLRFVPDVIFQCVKHFKNRSWIVRNSNIQLARSFIDRFLGVLIGHNNRPKSIEDLFRLFPQLINVFCQELTERPLTDSVVVVMQFFSESQSQPAKDELVEMTRTIFLRLFIRIIKENCDHYGKFAVRAYTSLCLEEHIPCIIGDIIEFIIENFIYIRTKHTIANFVLLLHELYDKYLGYINDVPVRKNDYFDIHASFDKLSFFLKQHNTKQFDLLLLKVLSTNEALQIYNSSKFNKWDYTQRVWLHNYIPFLVINTDENYLPNLLKEILLTNLLDCLQVKILSIIIDRYSKVKFCDHTVHEICNVLVQRMVTIENNREYLLLCYLNVILLFFKCHSEIQIYDHCIKEMRTYYGEVVNIHKILLFILLLTKVKDKTKNDTIFIKSAIRCVQDINLESFEMAEVVSELLPYIYVNAFCDHDRYILFKMAAYLLTEYGLWDFISFISKTKILSPSIALANMLSLDVLSECFQCSMIYYKFVTEFYDFVCVNNSVNSKKYSKTYYVEEKDVFVDRSLIDKIVLRFLYDFNKKVENTEWLSHYERLCRKNKR